MSSRPACSTKGVPGESGLHRKTLSLRKNKTTTTTKKEKRKERKKKNRKKIIILYIQKPMLFYTIILTGIENLIEVIMLSLVSFSCLFRLVFLMVYVMLNLFTPKNSGN